LRIAELAKALHLPMLTVRRVLAGQAAEFSISEAIVARVLEEARARGFPAPEHRPPARPAFSPALGLIVTDLTNPFFGTLAASAEEAARVAGYVTLIGASGEDLGREQALIRDLRERGAVGLLVAAAGPDYEHLRKLQDEHYPFVLLDRVFEDFDCDWVAVENQGAARALCEGLMERGARRVAYLGGHIRASTMRERLEGYRAALRRRQIPFDNTLVVLGDYTEHAGRTGADKLLQLTPPPDAIFCANNRIFTGCLDRLACAPEHPWRHMPCACFDELPIMGHLGRPLLVASQPERALAAKATALLLERLRPADGAVAKQGKPYRHELLEVPQKAFGF
jgi:LacI family transcriptional regulator